MTSTGCYLYAVIDDPSPRRLGPIGVDGADVYTLPEGPVAAVVSDVPNRRIRPERRKVAAHHRVLQTLMTDRAVLPLAFGLIADGAGAVRDILARNADGFAGQLDRVRGHVEMGLRVSLNVPNVVEYVLAARPDLRALRDEVFAPGASPGPDAKMELGRRFERAVQEARRAATDAVLAALRPAAAEVREEAPRGETEVMNLAFLVPAGGVAGFEAAVGTAAAGFGPEFVFAVSGPWPPHSFVQPDLTAPGE